MKNKIVVIFSKNKIGRFFNSFIHKQKNRVGKCEPTNCETLEGKKGAACCNLGYKCPCLSDLKCSIYKVRVRNCRVFPANEQDLKLVKNCSYTFE